MRDKVTEWATGHISWDIAKHFVLLPIAAWIASKAGAELMHATAVNLFLLVLGILGILWGIGLLPIRGKKDTDNLASKYHDLILAWTQLDDLYRNSPKDVHAPQTLPDPMGSKQIGDLDFRYRIGLLQGRTHAFLDDLAGAGIHVGYSKAEPDIRSVPELLAVLQRCKL
jgi:hypothetical protein